MIDAVAAASSSLRTIAFGASGSPNAFSTRLSSSAVSHVSPRAAATSRHKRARLLGVDGIETPAACPAAAARHSAYAAARPSARTALSGNV